MKRIISALLTFAMLLTLITVPMMVTVDAATYEKISDLYSETLPTRYAIKGTPTIDGDKSEWANAYTYRVDRSQNALLGGTAPMGTMADVYMMWDENYLYILEERFNETIVANATYYNFGNQGTAHYVVLPSDFTDDGVATNNGGAAMIYTVPAQSLRGSTTVGATGDSTINGRIKWYTSNALATAQANIVGSNYTLFTGDDATSWEGATSKTSLTETGYIMETRIPWDFLDQRCSEEFTPAADTVIGIGWNGGRKANSNFVHGGDTGPFQKLQLLGAGVPNPTVKPIVPDFSWYDVSQSELTINTAAQLLAFAELTNIHNDYAVWFKNNSKFGTADASALTNGKTFKLGANIDLNPGTTFNADGTYTGNTPLNGWGAIGRMSGGTFDGAGYTISGLYAPKGLTNGTHADEFGFIGRLSGGSTVKNLTLTNGYLAAAGSDTVGSVVGVVSGSTANGTAIAMTDIYSDVTVVGTNSADKAGGIYGAAYAGSAGYTNTLTNVVYAGTVTNGTTNDGGAIAGRLAWGSNLTVTMKNCYTASSNNFGAGTGANDTPTDTTNAAYIQSTPVDGGKFDIRVLGLIDETELDLDAVGMKVTVTYTDGSTEPATVTTYQPLVSSGTKVFKTVNANGTPIEVSSISAEAEYAYGAVLTNVPAGATDTVQITVVLTRTIDGVAVESTCAYSATYLAGAKQ